MTPVLNPLLAPMLARPMAEWLDLLGAVLLFLGALLNLVAAVGIIRFPDLLTRMHAATKPQVLGIMLMAGGLSLVLADWRATVLLVLVVGAQMVTAPVAGHMVSRAAYRAGQVRNDLLLVDELGGDLGGDPGGGADERGAP